MVYEQESVPAPPAKPATRVHPFGVSRERLQQSAGGAGLAVKVADSLSDADVVLTTKAHYRRRASVLVAAEEQGVPVYVLRRNTPGQIVGFIEQLSETDDNSETRHSGAAEAEEGVQRILSGETSTIELRPQSSFVRRIQHRIAEQAQLRSHSVGT